MRNQHYSRGSKRPSPHPQSPTLIMAELYLQRGEFDRAKTLLQQRVKKGASDFRTLILQGVAHAHLQESEQAIKIFQKLFDTYKSKVYKLKAGFNLGLTKFYQHLSIFGDMSVTRYRQSGSPPIPQAPLPVEPFGNAIRIWENLFKGHTKYRNVFSTYLSFAYLQRGELNQSLRYLRFALLESESLFVTHYVMGRIFLDLFSLASEENDFAVEQEFIKLFDIEPHEIVQRENKRITLAKETYLDLAIQSFLEARNLNPLSPETLLSLVQAYLFAGLFEEATETLTMAEAYSPNAQLTLEISLQLHQQMLAPPETIQAIIYQLKQAKQLNNVQRVYHILPPYYLF